MTPREELLRSFDAHRLPGTKQAARCDSQVGYAFVDGSDQAIETVDIVDHQVAVLRAQWAGFVMGWLLGLVIGLLF